MSKKKIKAELSANDYIIIKLQNFLLKKDTAEKDKEKARSLINWYRVNNFFTAAQRSLANNLPYIKKKPAVVKKHYLYAISNGDQVKLGMSSDVNKRLKSMQTASPAELVLLWKYYIANTPADAIKIEKMLHRACKEFHVRGEWFDMSCIDTVNKFNPNKKHSARWEYAQLISVDSARKSGVLNFTVERIRRNNVTDKMNRVWAQKDTAELYQVEIKKLLDDGEVVLLTHP